MYMNEKQREGKRRRRGITKREELSLKTQKGQVEAVTNQDTLTEVPLNDLRLITSEPSFSEGHSDSHSRNPKQCKQ